MCQVDEPARDGLGSVARQASPQVVVSATDAVSPEGGDLQTRPSD